MSYRPQARSTAARAIAWLSRSDAPASVTTTQLAEAIGVARDSLSTLLNAAVRHGALVKQTDNGRALYSLPEGRQAQAEVTPESAPEQQPEFTACLWLDGDLDVFGLSLVDAQDGSTGVRITRAQMRELVLMTMGGAE